MNAAQRKELLHLHDELTVIRDCIEEIQSDEEQKYENMPESLQGSERGESMQEGIDALHEIYCSLEDAIDKLNEVNGE